MNRIQQMALSSRQRGRIHDGTSRQDVDVDLPPFLGIDPLHPLVLVYHGEIAGLHEWTAQAATSNRTYTDCRSSLVKDPSVPVYLYLFGEKGGNDDLYAGVTRNPQIRFAQHRRHSSWWPHATCVAVYRIDCRWHDAPNCSTVQLDQSARYLEGWLIELIEPRYNRALGPIT